jgi:transcriptional antiterminator RfaH
LPVPWYLLRTKPASEALATEHLARQGFNVYFPRVAVPVRRRGRLVTSIRPLFPRYLFLSADSQSCPLGSVAYTRGITGFVKFGVDVAVVPGSVIEELRRSANSETGLHALRVARLFAGSRVRVAGGAFEGLAGVYQRQQGDGQVVVLLDLLGQSARVCLLAADVVADDLDSGSYAAAPVRLAC